MMINFDEVIDRHNTGCSKFDGVAAFCGRGDVLPLWVADMDFPVPAEVTAAVKQRAEHPIYGYNVVPESYFEAFIRWQKEHQDWDVQRQWLCHTPGVLTALSTAILAFTGQDDEVLIQPPVYFPFKSTIEALGRRVLNNQLIYRDGRFTMDFDDLEEKAKRAKLFVFCSPHNPSGRVWTGEELARVEQICQKNRLLVFSDEIHSDIVYASGTHQVFSKRSPWAEDNSIIAMAPSKTFNIAGLEMSLISIPNVQMREKYQYLLRQGLHVANPNSCGIAAAQAAYEHGETWYRQLLAYLQQNLDYLGAALEREVPQIRMVVPEATYIPLLDMSALHMDGEQLAHFMVHQVGAALNSGLTFGPGGEQFMRINVATQRANLERFVAQLKAATAAL